MKNTIEELKNKIAKRNQKNERDQKLIGAAILPVDGWYVDDEVGCEKWMFYKKNGLFIFGLGTDGSWKDYSSKGFKTIRCLLERLATPEESTERLTKFVNGLGYKEGVEVKEVRGDLSYEMSSAPLEFFIKEYNGEKDGCILLGAVMIWSSQRGWAKIVEQKPKYTVTPTQLGFEDNEVLCDYTILKDGKMLDLSEWEEIAKRLETFLNQEK